MDGLGEVVDVIEVGAAAMRVDDDVGGGGISEGEVEERDVGGLGVEEDEFIFGERVGLFFSRFSIPFEEEVEEIDGVGNSEFERLRFDVLESVFDLLILFYAGRKESIHIEAYFTYIKYLRPLLARIPLSLDQTYLAKYIQTNIKFRLI